MSITKTGWAHRCLDSAGRLLCAFVLAGSATAQAASDDLWDVSQGAAVTAHSAVMGPPYYASSWRSDIRDMFGGAFAPIERGNTLFQDFQAAGTLHWVEWQTPAAVTLRSINLDIGHDGGIRDARYRGASRVTLYVKNAGGGFDEIFEISPANPYGDTPAPPDATVSTNADRSRLVVCANLTPVTGQQFRAEFVQFGGPGNASGPRVIELDASAAGCPGLVSDTDGDGVVDDSDNCPADANPDQQDSDGDLQGDVCDSDDDNDGRDDTTDNCPFTPNPDQSDLDGDGLGDACDADPDGDGVVAGDNCPSEPNPDQSDLDADGLGDACDGDDEGDGVADADDNCPVTPNPDQSDLDGDGIGDACDADVDGDGAVNDADNCPLAPNPAQDDADSDGVGDACDADSDNDSVCDGPDAGPACTAGPDNCPFIPNLDQTDSDGDGRGDVCDADLDGDGVDNGLDNCPAVANASQNDLDGDGEGDACDADVDGDGVANAADLCAATPPGAIVNGAGCSIAQLVPCAGPMGTTTAWKNHGKYVSAVATTAQSFVEQGLISEAEKGAIVSAAAQSDCGQK